MFAGEAVGLRVLLTQMRAAGQWIQELIPKCISNTLNAKKINHNKKQFTVQSIYAVKAFLMELPGVYLLWHLRRWQKSAFNCSFSDLFNSSQKVWSLLHMVPWSFLVLAPGSLIWDRKPHWATEPPFIQTKHQSLKFVLTLVRDKRGSNTPQCRMQGSIQSKVQACKSMGQKAL